MTDNRTAELHEVCGDDRFDLIAKAREKLLDSTNIESRPEEVAVLDGILFRCWQMGWLDQLRDDAATQGSDRHPYEQRITGDGSDWGEIMRDAFDDLMASAGESCTPEQMRKLADHIRATLGSEHGTCHAESDLSEWVCSRCQCWIPLGLTPENIKNASEWRYCPHCGAKVKAVKR